MTLEGTDGGQFRIEEVPLTVFGYEAVFQPFCTNRKVVISDELPWFLKESKLRLNFRPYVIYNIELEKYLTYDLPPYTVPCKALEWEWNDNASSYASEDSIVNIIGDTVIIREYWEKKKNILAVPCWPYCKSIQSTAWNNTAFNFLYVDCSFDGAFYPLEVFDKELRGGGPR